VSADSAPDHMGVTLLNRIPIVEGGPAVWCPGHLEDALGTLDASDTEARAEAFNALQIFNELLHCFPKPPLLLP
jgi:hypothetical protein